MSLYDPPLLLDAAGAAGSQSVKDFPTKNCSSELSWSKADFLSGQVLLLWEHNGACCLEGRTLLVGSYSPVGLVLVALAGMDCCLVLVGVRSDFHFALFSLARSDKSLVGNVALKKSQTGV